MPRPFSLNLTEQEKQELMQAALKKGMSIEEFVNYALAEMLEHNATGVYVEGHGGGHGASG